VWLGGFQPILNQITVDNFNWFLHYLLFLLTQRVIKKQREKGKKNGEVDENDEGIDIEEDGE
jgi:hypothetical protein